VLVQRTPNYTQAVSAARWSQTAALLQGMADDDIQHNISELPADLAWKHPWAQYDNR